MPSIKIILIMTFTIAVNLGCLLSCYLLLKANTADMHKVNLVVIQGRTEVGPEDALRAADSHVHFDVYASAISKAHYNPWYCNYFKEPGYKCTGCSTALHCFPGNFALLIQCAGRLPYCSQGYCSATKEAKCIEEPSKYKKPASEENKPTEGQDDDNIEVEKPKIIA